MQTETQFTHSPQAAPNRAPVTAFSRSFLDQLRRLAERAEAAPPATQAEAVFAGPFAVEEVERPAGTRHAVVPTQEPATRGGKAAALHRRRDDALRLAAVLPAVAAPPLHHLGNQPKNDGCYTLHRGRRFVAHLSGGIRCLSRDQRRRLTHHLDLVHHLAANPHALALVLESVGPEVLPLLGRALARRIERALE